MVKKAKPSLVPRLEDRILVPGVELYSPATKTVYEIEDMATDLHTGKPVLILSPRDGGFNRLYAVSYERLLLDGWTFSQI